MWSLTQKPRTISSGEQKSWNNSTATVGRAPILPNAAQLTGILQHHAVKEPCPHFRDEKIDVKYVLDPRLVRVKTKIQNETLQIWSLCRTLPCSALVQKRAGQSFMWWVGKLAEWKRTPNQKIITVEVEACYQVLNEKQPGLVFQSAEYSYACKWTTLLLSLRNAHTESIPFRSIPDAGTPRLLVAEQGNPGSADTDGDVVSTGSLLYRCSAVFDEQKLPSSRSFHFRQNSCKPTRTDQLLHFHMSPCSLSHGEIRRVQVYKGHAAALLNILNSMSPEMDVTRQSLQRNPQKDFVKGISISTSENHTYNLIRETVLWKLHP